MVPHLAEKASQLTVFMRNVTWIAPQIASSEQAAAEDGELPTAQRVSTFTHDARRSGSGMIQSSTFNTVRVSRDR